MLFAISSVPSIISGSFDSNYTHLPQDIHIYLSILCPSSPFCAWSIIVNISNGVDLIFWSWSFFWRYADKSLESLFRFFATTELAIALSEFTSKSESADGEYMYCSANFWY